MDSLGSNLNVGSSTDYISTNPYGSKLNISGLGGNIDVDGIVSQLMQIEREPLTALNTEKQDYQAQLASWKQFNGLIVSLLSGVNLIQAETNFAQKNC